VLRFNDVGVKRFASCDEQRAASNEMHNTAHAALGSARLVERRICDFLLVCLCCEKALLSSGVGAPRPPGRGNPASRGKPASMAGTSEEMKLVGRSAAQVRPHGYARECRCVYTSVNPFVHTIAITVREHEWF
jgi:hypothetical protein